MSLHRFFVPERPTSGYVMSLPPGSSRQVARVLRLRKGDRIAIFDGSGGEWPATLEVVTARGATALVGPRAEPEAEPRTRLTLSQALLKSDHFELVLQKATELGVSQIRPFVSARSVARPPSPSRLSRWERIMMEASEQSGRTIVPVLLPATDLAGAVAAGGTANILLWEAEDSRSLEEALGGRGVGRVNLIVGPEGGFSAGEVEQARQAGCAVAGLGPRILRAETAAIAAVAATMYALGEMAPREKRGPQ